MQHNILTVVVNDPETGILIATQVDTNLAYLTNVAKNKIRELEMNKADFAIRLDKYDNTCALEYNSVMKQFKLH